MNLKKRRNIIIIAVFYFGSQLIANGLNQGNWSLWFLLKHNWAGFLGFFIGISLLFYFDKDFKNK